MAGVSPPSPSLLALIGVYTKIGILGFGGGYAVLAFIRSEVVDKHGWQSAEQFDHVVEMTAFAPGPTTSNVLAAIAFRLHGWKGMVLGSIAALWPSFVLIMILAAVTRVLHNPWLSGALHGIEHKARAFPFPGEAGRGSSGWRHLGRPMFFLFVRIFSNLPS